MSDINWDAALVLRANELLSEVRRYHVDAEATRLQLASTAASIAQKIDELPAVVGELVEACLQQDPLRTERPFIAKRLDLSTRMLNQLAEQLHGSGTYFLRHVCRISTLFLITGACVGAATAFWASKNSTEALRLSAEISILNKTIDQFQKTGGQAVIKSCTDSLSRPRLCVRIDENASKTKDSYYFVAR